MSLPSTNRLRRLQRELENFDTFDLAEDKPLIYAQPVGNGSDLGYWFGVIEGPRGTPYQDRCFHVAIRIPDDYPNTPPLVRFITSILHPNIYVGDDWFSGKVCLDVLEDEWSPALVLQKVLLCVQVLLDDPNYEDAANADFARAFLSDPNTALNEAKSSAETNAFRARDVKELLKDRRHSLNSILRALQEFQDLDITTIKNHLSGMDDNKVEDELISSLVWDGRPVWDGWPKDRTLKLRQLCDVTTTTVSCARSLTDESNLVTIPQAEKVLQQAVENVEEILRVPNQLALRLLIARNWNRRAVITDWIQNPIRLKKDAGIAEDLQLARLSAEESHFCCICSEEVSGSAALLHCSHRIHHSCLAEYVGSWLAEQLHGQRLNGKWEQISSCPNCPNTPCSYPVCGPEISWDQEFFERPEVLEGWKATASRIVGDSQRDFLTIDTEKLLRGNINENRYFEWPGVTVHHMWRSYLLIKNAGILQLCKSVSSGLGFCPFCDKLMQLSAWQRGDAVCSNCKSRFCIYCRRPHHEPLSCRLSSACLTFLDAEAIPGSGVKLRDLAGDATLQDVLKKVEQDLSLNAMLALDNHVWAIQNQEQAINTGEVLVAMRRMVDLLGSIELREDFLSESLQRVCQAADAFATSIPTLNESIEGFLAGLGNPPSGVTDHGLSPPLDVINRMIADALSLDERSAYPPPTDGPELEDMPMDRLRGYPGPVGLNNVQDEGLDFFAIPRFGRHGRRNYWPPPTFQQIFKQLHRLKLRMPLQVARSILDRMTQGGVLLERLQAMLRASWEVCKRIYSGFEDPGRTQEVQARWEAECHQASRQLLTCTSDLAREVAAFQSSQDLITTARLRSVLRGAPVQLSAGTASADSGGIDAADVGEKHGALQRAIATFLQESLAEGCAAAPLVTPGDAEGRLARWMADLLMRAAQTDPGVSEAATLPGVLRCVDWAEVALQVGAAGLQRSDLDLLSLSQLGPEERRRRQQAMEDQLSQQELARISQPCPGIQPGGQACGASCQKVDGCDTVGCSLCGSAWCWRCGSLLDRGGRPGEEQRSIVIRAEMRHRSCRCRELGARGAGERVPHAPAGLVIQRQLLVLRGGEGDVAGRLQRRILAALKAQGCLDVTQGEVRAPLVALNETLKAHLALLEHYSCQGLQSAVTGADALTHASTLALRYATQLLGALRPRLAIALPPSFGAATAASLWQDVPGSAGSEVRRSLAELIMRAVRVSEGEQTGRVHSAPAPRQRSGDDRGQSRGSSSRRSEEGEAGEGDHDVDDDAEPSAYPNLEARVGELVWGRWGALKRLAQRLNEAEEEERTAVGTRAAGTGSRLQRSRPTLPAEAGHNGLARQRTRTRPLRVF